MRKYLPSCSWESFFSSVCIFCHHGGEKKQSLCFWSLLYQYSNCASYVFLLRKYAAVLHGKTKDLYVLTLNCAHQFQLIASIAPSVRSLWKWSAGGSRYSQVQSDRSQSQAFWVFKLSVTSSGCAIKTFHLWIRYRWSWPAPHYLCL